MTPNSSVTPYVLPADMYSRFDPRLMAQLCSIDPANPVTYPPDGDTDTLSTNSTFLEQINIGCGELESACLRAGIYQVSDLQSLQGMSLSYMKTIIASIVIMNLYNFRSGPNPSEAVVNNYNKAMEALTDLSDGKRIFSFAQTEQAGLPTNYRMTAQNQIQNDMVTARWQRMFGVRQNLKRLI
jgi:hypothetical protein